MSIAEKSRPEVIVGTWAGASFASTQSQIPLTYSQPPNHDSDQAQFFCSAGECSRKRSNRLASVMTQEIRLRKQKRVCSGLWPKPTIPDCQPTSAYESRQTFVRSTLRAPIGARNGSAYQTIGATADYGDPCRFGEVCKSTFSIERSLRRFRWSWRSADAVDVPRYWQIRHWRAGTRDTQISAKEWASCRYARRSGGCTWRYAFPAVEAYITKKSALHHCIAWCSCTILTIPNAISLPYGGPNTGPSLGGPKGGHLLTGVAICTFRLDLRVIIKAGTYVFAHRGGSHAGPNLRTLAGIVSPSIH